MYVRLCLVHCRESRNVPRDKGTIAIDANAAWTPRDALAALPTLKQLGMCRVCVRVCVCAGTYTHLMLACVYE